jgi:acetoin utilization protein AcuC
MTDGAHALIEPMSRIIEPKGPVFISGDIYRKQAYGANHPLTIPRVEIVSDLCRRLGWLDDENFMESPQATTDELTAFHDPAYVEAVCDATAAGKATKEQRRCYSLGTIENPIFPHLFERASISAAGSLQAADLVTRDGVAVNFGGGTHHAAPGEARGFCYFNDAVLAIGRLRSMGLARILYVDLDAHHGDGVEYAFAGDPDIFTVSLHEAGRWPQTGGTGFNASAGFSNLAVPKGFNDVELSFVADYFLRPFANFFKADAILINCGADSLAGDPLASMGLSNGALWSVILDLANMSPRAIIVGGGGYNPWTTARYWTGLWGLLNGKRLPARLPADCVEILSELDCDLVDEEDRPEMWLTTLADPAMGGPVRNEVSEIIDVVRRGWQPPEDAGETRGKKYVMA